MITGYGPIQRTVRVWAPVLFFLVVALFPFYWMAITSIKPNAELYSQRTMPLLVHAPTLKHYIDLLNTTSFLLWTWNTMVVAVVSTAISLVLGIMLAYPLARINFPGAGLLAIAAYHRSQGEHERNVCLIPSSAHGTNAASAVMAGMRVVVVASLQDGTVDLEDLRRKCEEHGERLAAIMVTYPSTHGVYEEGISDMCALVHQHGGQVYIDGANLNALLGLAEPGQFGGDVSHLNLHKTFCIPHGGGGPGVGPVAVAEHLVPFLPSHPLHPRPAQRDGIGPVSAAPFGSAGILAISWAYIRMLSGEGLAHATKSAVLAANYVAARLAPSYPILYTGKHALVAHECILDLRGLTKATGVTVDDVAKRLIDYGFHAPTVSFPVAGTLMVEPTESEDLAELDRFCDAMIAIRAEIDEVASGRWEVVDSPLRGAPHTAVALVSAWERAYDRHTAVYPAGQTAAKYWPPVARINQAYGDRNLVCNCPPPEAFED